MDKNGVLVILVFLVLIATSLALVWLYLNTVSAYEQKLQKAEKDRKLAVAMVNTSADTGRQILTSYEKQMNETIYWRNHAMQCSLELERCNLALMRTGTT